MGMNCGIYRVSSSELEQLVRQPERLDKLLGVDDAPPVREVRPKGILGFLLRLTPVRVYENDPNAPEREPVERDPSREIDINKAWHGVHFLLTGTAGESTEPATYLLSGGEELDDEGMARALRPAQVKRFAEFLSGLTIDDVARQYDPPVMTKLRIYPLDDWTARSGPDDDHLHWLLDAFTEMRSFVQRTAEAGDGLVIHVA